MSQSPTCTLNAPFQVWFQPPRSTEHSSTDPERYCASPDISILESEMVGHQNSNNFLLQINATIAIFLELTVSPSFEFKIDVYPPGYHVLQLSADHDDDQRRGGGWKPAA